MNLKEPNQTDWDAVSKGTTYTPPPPAQDATGKFIPYIATLPQSAGSINPDQPTTDEGYRRYEHGPLKLQDGTEIRFYSTTLKPFINKKTGEPNGKNSTALLLKGAGVTAKPQSTTQYDEAIKLVRGRKVPVTINWRAKDKDSGFTVDEFSLFPFDPDRPGQRKSILKNGDMLTDGRVVPCEVLFANAQIRFIEDPTRK